MSAGQPLIVAIERTDPVVVITAAGELDAATVGRLDSAIDEAIREHEHHVVLDASGVSFVDSTGITALISGLRRLNRSRRRLALACTAGAASSALPGTAAACAIAACSPASAAMYGWFAGETSTGLVSGGVSL